MTTTASTPTPARSARSVLEVVRRYWGYSSLRPLQAEAIAAGLDRRDSLVVLPTGGGKSLCYEVPPVVAGRTDIVVSPLISLMKDQVDALQSCGYPAAALHSGLGEEERRRISGGVLAGKYRLLFLAPERLLTPWFLSLVQRLEAPSFSIDEAHCISQWGHDFRPEYRRLSALRDQFPDASIHAYTATATPRVRDDIIQQLGLRDPRVLVGRFDRPNLVYRVVPRADLHAQVLDTIRRHEREAVIVYCISRADTESLASSLRGQGVKAAAYHAGLDARTRAATQDQFAAERIDVVVATVAFGMGIDRSNVRCVIHAALPKSIEHYQQETGRAGRDGLEAECVLFYSASDARRWESLLRKSALESQQPPDVLRGQLALLEEMNAFAAGRRCRHRALSTYFGQEYEAASCKACDVCLSPDAGIDNGDEIAQAALGCVAALRAPFGVGYVADVLRGSHGERISRYGHDKLAQYGVLKALDGDSVRDLVLQLVEQGCLERSKDERPVLRLTAAGRDVLKERRSVTLFKPRTVATGLPESSGRDRGGVDTGLFEHLRTLRRRLAEERSVPAFVVLSDAVLADLARLRPGDLATLRRVKGIGEHKLAELGPRLLESIAAYCNEHGLRLKLASPARMPAGPAGLKAEAYRLFAAGSSIDAVAAATGRARGTVASYLEDFIAERRPDSIAPWVDGATRARVLEAAAGRPGSLLKPVFEALDGSVSYDDIRIVMRHAGLR